MFLEECNCDAQQVFPDKNYLLHSIPFQQVNTTTMKKCCEVCSATERCMFVIWTKPGNRWQTTCNMYADQPPVSDLVYDTNTIGLAIEHRCQKIPGKIPL